MFIIAKKNRKGNRLLYLLYCEYFTVIVLPLHLQKERKGKGRKVGRKEEKKEGKKEGTTGTLRCQYSLAGTFAFSVQNLGLTL